MSGVLDRLTVFIAQGATQKDLTDLDAEIARLQAVRSLVADALMIQGGTRPDIKTEVAKPGNSPRAAAPTKPGPKPKSGLVEERRRKILGLLAVEKLSTAQIAERLPLNRTQTTELMSHPWFTQENRLQPWELSEAGRAWLRSQPSAAT